MNAAAEPAQLPGASVLTHGEGAGSGENPLRNEDLPRPCHVAEPGSQVGDAADRRVVVPAVEADSAEGRIALGDPDPQGEVVPLARPGLRQATNPGPHGNAHPDRARRPIVAADW